MFGHHCGIVLATGILANYSARAVNRRFIIFCKHFFESSICVPCVCVVTRAQHTKSPILAFNWSLRRECHNITLRLTVPLKNDQLRPIPGKPLKKKSADCPKNNKLFWDSCLADVLFFLCWFLNLLLPLHHNHTLGPKHHSSWRNISHHPLLGDTPPSTVGLVGGRGAAVLPGPLLWLWERVWGRVCRQEAERERERERERGRERERE